MGENDIVTLSTSFLTAQAVRYGITGVLPNPEGEEPWNELVSHPSSDLWKIFGVAFFFCCIVSWIAMKEEALEEEEAQEEEEEEKLEARVSQLGRSLTAEQVAECANLQKEEEAREEANRVK